MSESTLPKLTLKPLIFAQRLALASLPAALLYSTPSFAETTQLQAITVQGEKMERTEMQTITGTTIFTDAQIEEENKKTVLDMVQEVPNVTVGGYGGIANIRGVDGNGGGKSSYSWVGATRPRTSTVIDGVGQIWTGGNVLDNSIWDLEQIEVLRGPQSTTQGRAAIGGAIVIKTKDPTFEDEAAVRVGMQQANGRNLYQAAGMVSGPLNSDLAYRLSASLIKGESFIKYIDNNPNLDYNEKPNDVEHQDIKAKLLWQPEDNDRFSARFDIQHQAQKGPYIDSVISGDKNYEAPMDDDSGNYAVNHRIGDTTMDTFITNINYEIDAHTETTFIASYTQFKSGYYHNQESRSFKMDDWDQSSINLEGRVNFLPGASKLSGMIGASAIKDDQDIHIYYVEDNTDDYKSDLFKGKTETQTLSLFGEGEYALTEKFDVIFGGRLENESQTRDAKWLGNYTGLDDNDLDKTYLLPKVGMRYTFNADHVLGLDVRQGYTPGGLGWDRNNRTPTSNQTAYEYDPEYVTAVEMSSKNQFFNQRASLNMNIFYNDYTDYQAYASSGVTFGDGTTGAGIANVDKATTYGLEIEARALVTPQTEVYANAGLLNTRVDQFDANPSWEGNELPFAANNTFNIGVNHDFTERFSAGINGQHVGQFYDDLDNEAGAADDTNIVGDYTFVNLYANYRWKKATIRAYVNNLTDEYAVTDNNGITQNVLPPRTIGATLDYKF
jgi:outer membrane receptor protein involved in Fe transport